jgi:excisionase family DNA binding protein
VASESETTLLTVAEVAELLRLRPSTIYQAANQGRIPCVQVLRGAKKRVIRFRRIDIEALLTPSTTIENTSPRTPSTPGRAR